MARKHLFFCHFFPILQAAESLLSGIGNSSSKLARRQQFQMFTHRLARLPGLFT